MIYTLEIYRIGSKPVNVPWDKGLDQAKAHAFQLKKSGKAIEVKVRDKAGKVVFLA